MGRRYRHFRRARAHLVVIGSVVATVFPVYRGIPIRPLCSLRYDVLLLRLLYAEQLSTLPGMP